MESNNSNIFFDFPSFLKEDGDLEHEEIDKACLSHELFQDSNCLKPLLPLYFFLTRNREEKMSGEVEEDVPLWGGVDSAGTQGD